MQAGQTLTSGRNADEQVLMATVHGAYKDTLPNYAKLANGKYESEEAFRKAADEAAKAWEVSLQKLNGLLGSKQFLAGGITWVDFVVADLVQVLNLLSDQFLKNFPKLKEHQK